VERATVQFHRYAGTGVIEIYAVVTRTDRHLHLRDKTYEVARVEHPRNRFVFEIAFGPSGELLKQSL